MSRKFILGLAAVAALATAALASGSADAAINQRGGHVNVRPPVHRLPPPRVHRPHFHDHVRIHRIYERGYVRPVGFVQPVTTEGLCTCLTKGYTPEGIVVFKDLCTKEMASAPVEGVAPEKSGEIQSPSNFAGKTYQDYLAANPQAQSAEKKN
jgi:hypothetical protein